MQPIFNEYSVETKEQAPISFHFNKFIAILKCIFTKEAMYVFEFECNESDEYELIGCVFSKERMKHGES